MFLSIPSAETESTSPKHQTRTRKLGTDQQSDSGNTLWGRLVTPFLPPHIWPSLIKLMPYSPFIRPVVQTKGGQCPQSAQESPPLRYLCLSICLFLATSFPLLCCAHSLSPLHPSCNHSYLTLFHHVKLLINLPFPCSREAFLSSHSYHILSKDSLPTYNQEWKSLWWIMIFFFQDKKTLLIGLLSPFLTISDMLLCSALLTAKILGISLP